MPLFRYNSPYYAPLSSSAWYLVNVAPFVTLKSLIDSLHWLVLRLVRYDIYGHLTLDLFLITLEYLSESNITLATEDAAEKRSPEADYSAIKRLLKFSDEDLYMEEFFALIPGFLKSKVVQTQRILKDGLVSGALLEWTNRTLSSDTLSHAVKLRRIALCRKVMDITSLPVKSSTLRYGLCH